MALTLSDIDQLLNDHGRNQYGGEAINQLEHALQCAYLAEQAGETPETVTAAFLHDLGHLLAASRDPHLEQPLSTESDDLHQYVAIPFLRGLLPDAVLEPIRLHVDAKRYLCAIDANYWGTLSEASRKSLALQGGAFTAGQVQAFDQLPFAQEAVRLRRYDDLAKVPFKVTPGLERYSKIMGSVAAST